MKRLFKVLKISGLVVGLLLAVGLIVNAVLIRTSGARLEARLTQLRADGQPTSLGELAATPVPPEANAAVLLRRVKDQVQAVEKDLAAARLDSNAFSLDEQQAKALRAAFAAYPRLIPALHEAANCPQYDSQLDYTLEFQEFLAQTLPAVNGNRGVYRVLNGHILLLAKDGRHDDALAECITLFKLTRHFERDPTIISHLVTLACRGVAIHSANVVLQTGDVSADSRQALAAELALHDNSKAYQHALRTERACGLTAYQDLTPWSQNWLMRAYWNRELCHYLDLFSSEMAAAERPYSELSPLGFAESKSHPVAANMVAPLQAARDANTRVRAALRCLVVLTAIKGLSEEPSQAPDISKLGLPVEATTDPFNGRLLTIKKQPGGWLVYSVGKNLQDDGGKLAKYEDIGVGPKESKKERELDARE